MRIHLVTSEFDVLAEPGRPGWSGRALQVTGLAGALTDGGHDVTVVCPPSDGDGAVRSSSGPAVAHAPGTPDALREHLVREWRIDAPDVVHALDGVAGVAVADAAGATGAALVQSFPTVTGGGAPGGLGPAAQDVLLRRAERVVAASEAQGDDLLRRGAPRSRLRIVPPGVNTDLWHPDGESLRRGEVSRVVLVSSLEEGGGADDAVSALRHVRETELYVAGGPEPGRQGDADLVRLQQLAARSGVAGRVRFLGAVGRANVGRLMRSADVVVCPSRQGGCGGSVLEAMACGRPVVATAVGCQRDIVVDGVTGLQVRPGQPAELGTALRGVLADPTSCQAFGIAGRDRVLARYSWPRIGGAALDAYREAVHELHPLVPENVVVEQEAVEADAGVAEPAVAS